MSRIHILACLVLLNNACVIEKIEEETEIICGTVMAGAPVELADVEIYQLDPITGQIADTDPIAYTGTPTDENGNFCIEDVTAYGMLVFVATNGEIQEPWSNASAQLSSSHMMAVVDSWYGQERIVITPWTALAYQIAHARFSRAQEDSFYSAIIVAEELVYRHFIGIPINDISQDNCEAHLNCLRPIDLVRLLDIDDYPPEEENYKLSLLALSAVAEQWSGPGRQKNDVNSVELVMHHLVRDVTDGQLDGFEFEQALATTAETLRAELVYAFANFSISEIRDLYDTHKELFAHILSNTDPRLFR